MEKVLRVVKTLVVIVVCILVSFVAFGGVFQKDKGVWQSKLLEYTYGMDYKGYRELKFKLNDDSGSEKEYYIDDNGEIKGEVIDKSENDGSLTNGEIQLVDDDGNPITDDTVTASEENEGNEENAEEVDSNDPTSKYRKERRTIAANPDEVKTKENYNLAKKIVKQRFSKLNQYEYNIRLDEETGEMIVEVPDDNFVIVEQSLVSTKGNFQMIDAQNGLVLMDNSMIKDAYMASYQNQGYLIIEFKKEYVDTLKDISNTYVEVTEETEKTEESEESEESEEAGESEEDEHDHTAETKNVSIKIDNTTIVPATYFGEEISTGMLQLALGDAATSEESLAEIENEVNALAISISSENMPVEYVLSSDNLIKSEITNEDKVNIKIVATILVLIVSIILVLKYRFKGLMASLVGLFYIAVYTLMLRYTNVYITYTSSIVLGVLVMMNYMLFNKILKESKNEDNTLYFERNIKKYIFEMIPFAIVAIVFTFMPAITISSVGMVAFWGLIVQGFVLGLTYVMDII